MSAYRIFLSFQIAENKRSAQWDWIYGRVTSCCFTTQWWDYSPVLYTNFIYHLGKTCTFMQSCVEVTAFWISIIQHTKGRATFRENKQYRGNQLTKIVDDFVNVSHDQLFIQHPSNGLHVNRAPQSILSNNQFNWKLLLGTLNKWMNGWQSEAKRKEKKIRHHKRNNVKLSLNSMMTFSWLVNWCKCNARAFLNAFEWRFECEGPFFSLSRLNETRKRRKKAKKTKSKLI